MWGRVVAVFLVSFVLWNGLRSSGNSSPAGNKVCPAGGEDTVDDRRNAVVEAMKHAWDSYREHAWGMDELQPETKQGVDTFSGMGITVLDSLDTLHLMGLDSRFEEARAWVANELDFEKVGLVSVFETTIRALGGLLTAYERTRDQVFLTQAETLAYRLSCSFQSKIPKAECYLSSMTCPVTWRGNSNFLAEIGTLQLEFIQLGRLSQDRRVKNLGSTTLKFIKRIQSNMQAEYSGVPPYVVNLDDGSLMGSRRTFGAPADSFFEYLAKTWILTGKRESFLADMFRKSVQGLSNFTRPVPGIGILVVEEVNGEFTNKMEQFACYIPGMLVVGLEAAANDEDRREWIKLAEEITMACSNFFLKGTGGLAGESMFLQHDGVAVTAGYELRPETLEALFYMWRFTRKPVYRDLAWKIFQSIEEHCRLPGGYSAMQYMNGKYQSRDIMHSYFMAETLKYLFLTFSDDNVVNLSEYVFNTEGHPFRITL